LRQTESRDYFKCLEAQSILVKFIEKKKREQRKHTVDDGFKELLLGL
jgi:hypothetical protein